MAVAVSSADGLLSLLQEDDAALNLHALQALNRVVHDFWFQIAGSISAIESFAEDEGFSHRELASLVASKVPVLAVLRDRCIAPRVTPSASYAWQTIASATAYHDVLPAQVFYNLGELNEALGNALGAGKLFDVDEQSEYVQTILGALATPHA